MKAKRKPTWPHRSVTRITAHPNGQWCKKIRGKLYYFGPWDDPDAALRRWQAEAPDLPAGREPTRGDSVTLAVKTCVDAWLTCQEQRMESGEITSRTYADYVRSGQYLMDCLGRQRHVEGISPPDWARLRARARAGNKFTSPYTVTKLITVIRQCFKWAYQVGLIEIPMRFGPGFRTPSAKAQRLAKAARGRRLFTPRQVLRWHSSHCCTFPAR